MVLQVLWLLLTFVHLMGGSLLALNSCSWETRCASSAFDAGGLAHGTLLLGIRMGASWAHSSLCPAIPAFLLVCFQDEVWSGWPVWGHLGLLEWQCAGVRA